ncbi:hypothetical protein [Magnetospirillum sp. UT-4]|uniref:hypothetical protein n=1 Tax=Magnetospirillum sp. UT-4 TaxID=2681467 RepID=UPI001384E45B|nr:hypothetical protein [Magnetospirillum sp. UT-4]CAA7612113.1 hypothetical protein MTBUT4_110042 [Magnetospirillum sp. UT-4]
MIKPFYFMAIFWGAVHRGYLLRYLVASMLSPGNLPALDPARKNKFLLATTATDWADIQDEPLFHQLQAHCEVVWFEIPMPGPEDSKMRMQSLGHRLVSERCFADGALGVFLTPDIILSDGSLARIEHYARQGVKVLFSVAIRFSQDPIEQELVSRGRMRPDQPMAIGARELMEIGLANLHSETKRYEFGSPAFAHSPISVFWRASGGIVIYSFSWCPILVDYGALREHDTSTFDEWTLDGDYIYRNFPDARDVMIITDSDDVGMISLTREADLTFDLRPDPDVNWWLGGLVRRARLHALWAGPVMDPLKRDLFLTPVVFHQGGVTPELARCVKDSSAILRGAINRDGHLPLQFVRFVSRTVWRTAMLARQFRSLVRWHIRNRRFVTARVLWRLNLRASKPLIEDPQWKIVND